MGTPIRCPSWRKVLKFPSQAQEVVTASRDACSTPVSIIPMTVLWYVHSVGAMPASCARSMKNGAAWYPEKKLARHSTLTVPRPKHSMISTGANTLPHT